MANLMQTYSIERVLTKENDVFLKGIIFRAKTLEDILEEYSEEFL